MPALSRKITVGTTTFYVRVSWRAMRSFLQRLAELEEAELSPAARQLAADDAAREFLATVVTGWDGVVDGAGRKIDWAPDRLDELDASTVAELLRKICEPPEELGTKKGPSGWPWSLRTPKASR